jgi:hypothetical protein
MSKKLKAVALALTMLGIGTVAHADEPLIDPAAAGAAPRKIALVSAVGNVLHMVSAKQVVGSNMDPFSRLQLNIPDQRLNNTVLRGMDRAVGRIDPTAERVLLHVSAPDLSKTTHNDRANVTSADLLDKLRGFDERKNWDLIIAATPRYQHSGFDRMGDKLWGLGVYIYGLESAQVSSISGFESFAPMEEDVVTIKQKYASTKTFVAPFAYLRFTVFDAKTLKVIRTVDKLEARKTADPDCAALKIADCFTPDQLAVMIDRMAERTATAGVAGKIGTVEASDPKLVTPQPASK